MTILPLRLIYIAMCCLGFKRRLLRNLPRFLRQMVMVSCKAMLANSDMVDREPSGIRTSDTLIIAPCPTFACTSLWPGD